MKKRVEILLFCLLIMLGLSRNVVLAKNEEVTLYVVQDENTAICPEPNKKSGVIEHVEKGTVIACVDTVINSYGNLWMKTLEGHYVYSECLVKANLKHDNTYLIKNIDSGLYLNQSVNSPFALFNNAHVTTFELTEPEINTQLFRIHFVADDEAIIMAPARTSNYAINVAYRQLKSRATIYDTQLDTETWKFIYHDNNKYEFRLVSNSDMILTAQGGKQDVIIDTDKNMNQTWSFEERESSLNSNEYIIRNSSPSRSLYYYSPEVNSFPYNNGNCTWYSWGRASEILHDKAYFNGNACDFWNNRTCYYGFDTNVPREGSMAVWGGKYGHVAIVETICDDGSIWVSESAFGGYNGKDFRMKKYNVTRRIIVPTYGSFTAD